MTGLLISVSPNRNGRESTRHLWVVQLCTPGDHVMQSLCAQPRARAFDEARKLASALGLVEEPADRDDVEVFFAPRPEVR